MPTVLVEKGIKFRFYSADINEPPHIHAVQGNKKAKIWLSDLTFAYNRGFNRNELADINNIAHNNQKLFWEAWHAFFS